MVKSRVKKQTPLKVGFDLDGVLLYNPARILRPMISFLKKNKIYKERKELEFYVPKPGWEELFWELLHKSSIFIAPGFKQIKQLKDQGLIEPYVITGRFNHLKQDFLKWQKKMGADDIFLSCSMNERDEQPHLFKQRLIKNLDLDVFIEDNWDIVNYLSQQFEPDQCRVFWVSNFIDRQIVYKDKCSNFKQAMSKLKSML